MTLKSEIVISFYFKCPKCNLPFFGKPIDRLPGEMPFKKYPTICPFCDFPLTLEIKETKSLRLTAHGIVAQFGQDLVGAVLVEGAISVKKPKRMLRCVNYLE